MRLVTESKLPASYGKGETPITIGCKTIITAKPPSPSPSRVQAARHDAGLGKNGAARTASHWVCQSDCPIKRRLRRSMMRIPSNANPAKLPNKMTCAKSPLGNRCSPAQRAIAKSKGWRVSRTMPGCTGSKRSLCVPPNEKGLGRPIESERITQIRAIPAKTMCICQNVCPHR